ncbi:MAG: FAD:protein FMN transferase, partial [Pseudomonadales bacterium]
MMIEEMNRVLVLVLLMSVLSACGQVEPVQIDGATMGTTYSVKLVSDDVDITVLSEAVEAELRRVNAIMSTYIPDSEISRFNQAPLDTW